MRRILLTGATGFIGRNIAPLLRRIYDVTSPARAELDLLDADAVLRYLDAGRFDAVVHLANPTAQNPIDAKDELFERSMMVFSSLERCAGLYGKMLYIGSGAEYGKHRPIAGAEEDEFGKELPKDPYGLSRYLMYRLAESRDNIINFRVFGCYGPFDPPYKLIPHIIACIREKRPILLNQDVWFDFLFAEDIFPVLTYFIENQEMHKSYNLCSGERVKISSIAKEVVRQTGAESPIEFKKGGLGLEYTGSNERLRAEVTNWKPMPLREGVEKILERETRK